MSSVGLLILILLDDMKFEPGNRPYWEMKEGRAPSRYPDLLRTLSKVSTGSYIARGSYCLSPTGPRWVV